MLPRLHPAQLLVKGQSRRFNALACGRRWGKTTIGEDREFEPALRGLPVAWGAPNYKYLLQPFEDAKRLLHPVVARCSDTEKRIELTTGGRLDFWSLDSEDAGRSYKYARWIVDEAGFVKNLERTFNEAIRPTLTDLRGDAWLLGTPKGRNYFWQAFCKGQDAHDEEWASWQMPTVSNPTIPNLAAEVEAARRSMPDRAFRQEYLAEFIEDAGGVFRGVSLAVDAGRAHNEPPQDGRAYQAGCDLARVQDFTVIDVVDSSGRQVYHDRFNQISWERQESEIVTVCRRYRCPLVLDSNGVGDPVYEKLRKTGLQVKPFTFTNASKENLVDNLAMRIEQGTARLMDVPEQTSELQAFQYELTPSRNVRMAAPEGMHDDCVIALALAYHGLDAAAGKAGALQRQGGFY